MAEKPYIVIHYRRTAPAAYRLDGGELIETVEQLPDGSWDWAAAGVCDPLRASDPDVVRGLAVALRALGGNP